MWHGSSMDTRKDLKISTEGVASVGPRLLLDEVGREEDGGSLLSWVLFVRISRAALRAMRVVAGVGVGPLRSVV